MKSIKEILEAKKDILDEVSKAYREYEDLFSVFDELEKRASKISNRLDGLMPSESSMLDNRSDDVKQFRKVQKLVREYKKFLDGFEKKL